MDKDLKEKTLDELEQIVVGLGQKKYLAGYVFGFIHTKGISEISQITPLSKTLREQLAKDGYFISQLKVISKLADPDGTVKYLFELPDGNRIETVLLFDDDRRTLCVSTQVGCAMNCAFCATAKVRLQRNLTAAEIVDQVNTVVRDASCVARANYAIRNTHDAGRITNVVYMGMGEPLQNYDAVVKSVRILNDPAGKNIGMRHITISTCGIVLAIKKLADEDIHPRLAISLNAPTDALRAKFMPINSKYSIAELIEAAKFYRLKAKQRVTFEYVMIKGVNDTVLHAQVLARLVRGTRCRVNPPHAWRINLIEFNPYPGCEFVASGRERIERFKEILEEAGIKTTVRFKMGQSINAACGQLGAGWGGKDEGRGTRDEGRDCEK